MNEARVKRLAKEGSVEFTRKIFRRIVRENGNIQTLASSIAKSEVVREDVFADPDFTFSMRLPKSPDSMLVCVQTPDGKYVRVVGVMNQNGKEK